MKRFVNVCVSVLMAALIIVSISGCGKDKGKVVASVGDRKIYIDDVNMFFDRSGVRFLTADDEFKAKRDFIDTLVSNDLLILGAYEKNIDQDPEVIKVVEGEEVKFLLDILFDQEIISKANPSEAEIKDWYAKGAEEIKASHIVVESEDQANDLLKQLKDGAIFEDLAVNNSLDPSAKRNQGDVGWFSWGMMVDNFQDAAYAMQPGEISAPVKTQFGYHIIKVVDRRKVEHRPTYGELKEQIRTNIIERRRRDLMRDYVEKLKAKYPITIEKPTCQFVLNKLSFLYPDTIGTRPRWRNNIDPAQLDMDEKALVLGRYKGGQLTIGDYLSNLRRLREEQRPDFDQYDSLSSIVFQMSLMDILALEARAQGLDKSEKYLTILKKFRERAMADVMRNDSLANQVEINEGEIQQYYDTHQEEFTTPLRFHLIELQVETEKEALRYRGSLLTEAQFKKTAAEKTLRPGKRQKSGDLGIITRDQYPGLYDIAVKTQGNVTKPVNIANKWSIAWIKERLEPEVRSFDACRYEINDRLLKEKGNALFTSWIEDMKKRFPVEISDDVLRESIDQSKYTQADTAQAG